MLFHFGLSPAVRRWLCQTKRGVAPSWVLSLMAGWKEGQVVESRIHFFFSLRSSCQCRTHKVCTVRNHFVRDYFNFFSLPLVSASGLVIVTSLALDRDREFRVLNMRTLL